MNIPETVIALVRSELLGEKLCAEAKNSITADTLPRIYAFSKSHDIANIVGDALDREKLLEHDKTEIKFRTEQFLAVNRVEKFAYEFKRVSQTLEHAEIEHIPLKGTVLRGYYPRPEMRTSCDIDILVKESELGKAINVLNKEANLKYTGRWTNDVNMYTEDGVHIEIHFGMMPDIKQFEAVFEDVWEDAKSSGGLKFCLEMSHEMFVYHHFAHMAKHFLSSGFGIRPIIDLYVINNYFGFDEHKLAKLLEKGGLTKFYEGTQKLCRVWFGNESHNADTLALAEHIYKCGIYGTMETRVAVNRKKDGRGLKHIIKRLFPSFHRMQLQYPVLKKCPLLLPFYYAVRFFKMLFRGDGKKAIYEIKTVNLIDENELNNAEMLMKTLGF